METIMNNPALLWFLIGLGLLFAELIVPGLVIIFFGIGAWVTALLSLVIPMSLNVQLLVFLVASLLSLVLLRHYVAEWFKGRLMKSHEHNDEDDVVGREAEVTKLITAEAPGEVRFKGAEWQAESTQVLEPGERVLITGRKSIRLLVERK